MNTGSIFRFALVIFFLLAAASRSALAATPDALSGARWGCWFDIDDLSIRCLLIRDPDGGFEERATAVQQKIDTRLPPLVRVIWGNPETLSGVRIRIPLWNVPYEMAFARQLAESVMCGLRYDCSVLFDANGDGLGPRRIAQILGGADESTIMAVAPASEFAVIASVEENVGARRKRRL